MLSFLKKILGKQEPSSKNIAKERLRLVLMHDTAFNLAPQLLENLKEEIIEVLSKHIEIDTEESDINLDKDQDTIALVANITVKSIKRV